MIYLLANDSIKKKKKYVTPANARMMIKSFQKSFLKPPIKRQYTCNVHENWSVFKNRPPPRASHSPCVATSKIFLPCYSWTFNFKPNPPLQMITALKGNITLGWLLYVIRSFLQVGFIIFSISSLTLFGFPLISFHLAEANPVPKVISSNY